MKLNKEKFERKILKCNICGSKKIKDLLKSVSYWEFPEYEFNISKCSNCGLIFLNPRPRKELISTFYNAASYWGNDMLSSSKKKDYESERDRNFFPVYNLILKDIKKGKILDIGAGTGIFLTKFKELGWDTHGIELSKDAVNFAKKEYKLNLKTGDFLENKNVFASEFDLVTLNMVLEHLYSPLETLKACRKVLKAQGRILIVVPNIESLGFKIFGKHWHPLQPPIHLNHFSPPTLSRMLEELGFKILNTSQFYFLHNYSSLFESFRFLFSKHSNEVKAQKGRDSKKAKGSFIKEAGKIFAKIFAYSLSYIGPVIGHGETIIIYAEKN